MIKVYRKTPTIKAEQFDGSREMAKKYHVEYDGAYILPFRIETKNGWLGMKVSDWILTDTDGKHWPIADDVFKKTYDELPVIPGYVAKYINHRKLSGWDIWDVMHDCLREDRVDEYMEDSSDVFARAWIDGYQVEE